MLVVICFGLNIFNPCPSCCLCAASSSLSNGEISSNFWFVSIIVLTKSFKQFNLITGSTENIY